MNITIPEFALVVLIGTSGAGKSTFARAHFKPTEVLSSDFCRGLVSDDENSLEATDAAFDVLHYIAAKRLAGMRLTVVDATNVQPDARKPLLALAAQYHCLPVAIVLNLPERLCHDRNMTRPDRDFGPHVIHRQHGQLRRSLHGLQREGFRYVHVLSSPEEVAAVSLVRQPLWNNLSTEHGPFDIIGDVHGCFDELRALLVQLGYAVAPAADGLGVTAQHPAGRKAIFLGDLVDRGPDTPGVLRLVMNMVAAEAALAVPGNHDIKLVRALRGKKVQITHGLADSLAQLAAEPPALKEQVAAFLDGLVSHYVLDEDKLVVAHAGLPATMQGRGSGKVREFALYGETTGETDEFGLPVRWNWAAEYRGKAQVIYGHTPVPQAEWLNRTINIDTGCVFGGQLTALRYPENELVAVPAARVYSVPARPLHPAEPPPSALTAQQTHDDVLELADVQGKRIISTRLAGNVTIQAANATAALEVMSRFAVAPQWLIYLPPTMSPAATSQEPGLLEHPAEAFAYYRHEGVPRVVCEEKHMGSRAVLIVCRDAEAARRRFGLPGAESGVCYTRTGRRFFTDPALETEFLGRVRTALTITGFWDEFATDWVALDAELMPWSVKAQELLRQQYAGVGAAARAALAPAVAALAAATITQPDLAPILDAYQTREQLADQYVAAYRHYCWPVEQVTDLKLAPFHLLATAGVVHTGKDHGWHMATLARLCAADPELLLPTATQVVDLSDPASETAAIAWWEALTGRGGEGMVVKPWDFITAGRRGVVQPAVKCRGREYLRIIYGPEYTLPANLERLRARGLGAKRALALREFALGVEALERFARGEPLRRVHECVFGVLALESEPVDPRL